MLRRRLLGTRVLVLAAMTATSVISVNTLWMTSPAVAAANTTLRVSVANNGSQANADGHNFAVSGNGRFVAIESLASNMVSGDTNGVADIFVRDLVVGTTERITVATNGTQSNGHSEDPAISADGRYVVFTSMATNLVTPGDTNATWDVFIRDRILGTTEQMSVASGGVQGNNISGYAPRLSPDGRYVTFASKATNLVAGDTNATTDVFVRDRVAGTTERVSIGAGGVQGNGESANPGISADGRYVTFFSGASTLVSGDSNGNWDVFLRDRVAGTIERISVSSSGVQGNGGSVLPSISADGRYVTYYSGSTNLVVGDTNASNDVFLRDRQLATTLRVSVGTSGAQANGQSLDPDISPDGRFVTFSSVASNLVAADTNGVQDVFLRDVVSSSTERLSVSSAGAQGDQTSALRPGISDDGLLVAFWSRATNLVSGDTNGSADVFTRERQLPPIGAIEEMSGELIQGWAHDPNDRRRPVTVKAYVDGAATSTGSALADMFRGPCAPPNSDRFEWSPPSHLLDGRSHTIQLRALDAESGTEAVIASNLQLQEVGETFSAADGADWDSSKWTSSTASTADVDVVSGAGRLSVSGAADAKALSRMDPLRNAEVRLTYQFENRDYRSGLRTTLRAQTSGSSLVSGYRLEVQSDSATVKLRRLSGGAVTDTASFTYSKDTLPQRLRFSVNEGVVKVKIWPLGTSEPSAWSLEYADAAPLAGSGLLQLHHNGTGGSRSVFVDDVRLTAQQGGPLESFDADWEADEDVEAVFQTEQFVSNIKANLPGRYAGTWLDTSTAPSKLCVALVNATAADRNTLLGLFAGPPDRLVLVTVTYSEAQLDSYKATLSGIIDSHTPKPYSTMMIGVDHPTNTVAVKVDVSDPVLESNLRAAVPSYALRFLVDPTFQLGQAAGHRFDYPPLIGGLLVDLPNLVQCTTGFTMAAGTSRAGSTAGHCTVTGDNVAIGGTAVGKTSINPYRTYPTGVDAAIFTNGGTTAAEVYLGVDRTRRVRSAASSEYQLQQRTKFVHISAGNSPTSEVHKIVAVNKTYTVEVDDVRTGQSYLRKYEGLSCFNGKTLLGDSGSPLFQKAGTGARAMGLLALNHRAGQAYSCFEPIHKVEDQTGMATFLDP